LTTDGELARFAMPPQPSLPWLFADPSRQFAAIATTEPVQWPTEFRGGGLVLLGDRLGEANELRLLVDVGAIGANRVAGHGHADALALTLSVGGTELLIDPGTGSYNADPVARRYFRSTRAHNTATIDDQDQAVWGGSFLWLTDVRTRLIELRRFPRRETLTAEHDGYLRLADPVRHCRRIEVDQPSRRIAVHDRFECRSKHQITLHWHFHPDCKVSPEGSGSTEESTLVERNGHRLRITPQQSGICSLIRGANEPMLGWYSPAFSHRLPTTTLVQRCQIDGAAELLTILEVLETPTTQSNETGTRR
jgi:hypothetical protein